MHLRTRWAAARIAMAVTGCAALLVACSKSGPSAAPSQSGAAPSQSGAAADWLPAAIGDVMNTYTTLGDNVRAIIVNVNGRTRFERYYSSSSPDESRSSYSMTKSVTSTLVGIAIGEGRLRLDERLSQMLPRYATEMKPSVARVTLRQLLTMTGGFTDTLDLTDDKMLTSPDWVRYALAHQDYPPGPTGTTPTTARTCWRRSWCRRPANRCWPTPEPNCSIRSGS
jgi:CubicO group peptidase (beta-lactamase class C family)